MDTNTRNNGSSRRRSTRPSTSRRTRHALDKVAEAVAFNLFVAANELDPEDGREAVEAFLRTPPMRRLLDREVPEEPVAVAEPTAPAMPAAPEQPLHPPMPMLPFTGPMPFRMPRHDRPLADHSPQQFLRGQELLAKLGRKPVRVPAPGEPVRSNLKLIQRAVGASDVEAQLLLFSLVIAAEPTLQFAIRRMLLLEEPDHATANVAAVALGLDVTDVIPLLSSRGVLARSGMIEPGVDYGGPPTPRAAPIDPRLLAALFERNLTTESFTSRFIEPAPAPTLTLDDLPGIRPDLDRVVALLKGAMASKALGINVLFWGPTGVGKTEAAKLVAAAAHAHLYAAGISDDDGQTPTARERLASAVIGNRMLNPAESLLLIDEADDLTGDRFMPTRRFGRSRWAYEEPDGDSKAFLNLMLEQNRVPTLWSINDVQNLDPAFRRRFAAVLAFPPLDVGQRRRVLARHLSATSAVTEQEQQDLATRFQLSAAHFAGSVRAAQVAGREDASTINALLEQHALVERGSIPPPVSRPVQFITEAVNCAADLTAIGQRLAAWKPSDGPGVSLCAYGPPGSGKSEFVHHLARLMQRRVVLRRVSDIESKYVGETEANIAAAFREAAAEDAILLFDEADSFLRDRRRVTHSFEANFVNEFLSQLEAHKGVCCCTTNAMQDLDQAAMRRFTWKLAFNAPRPEQAALLFQRLLAGLVEPMPEDRVLVELLRPLGGITAGDIAVVAKRLRVLRAVVLPEEAVAELRLELRLKDQPARPVGFGREQAVYTASAVTAQVDGRT